MNEGRERELSRVSLSKTRCTDYIVGSQFNGFTHSPPDPVHPDLAHPRGSFLSSPQNSCKIALGFSSLRQNQV